MIEIDKNGFPRLEEDTINLAGSAIVPTRSGNPFHDPHTGQFTYAPPGVSVLAGTEHIKNLSSESRQVLFDRAAFFKANQVTARVIDGNLHLVLMREGRRLNSFALPPIEMQKALAKAEQEGELGGKAPGEGEGPGFPGETLQITGEIRDAIMEAARDLDLVSGGVLAFVEGKTGLKFSPAQRKEILALIDKQRINDLIDYLHQNLRRNEMGVKDPGKVRILTPRGYLRKSVSRLNEKQMQEVLSRLQARGWQEKVIHDRITSGLPARFKKIFHVGSKETKPKRSSAAGS